MAPTDLPVRAVARCARDTRSARLPDAIAAPADTGPSGARIGAAAALILVLASCATGVQAASPAQATGAACAAVIRHWPQRVAHRDRVSVRDEPAGIAAWGDPAIIARCGVPPPAPTTNECIGVDDIDWVLEPLSDGARFTTYGRSPAVEILVPHSYAPEPLVLGAFTAAARQLPTTDRRCR
ncbi:MAG: DUF3515 family protein [Micrococcales bacterium]|nr:DUF3515 family protein [Micrococcales bacterium]